MPSVFGVSMETRRGSGTGVRDVYVSHLTDIWDWTLFLCMSSKSSELLSYIYGPLFCVLRVGLIR